ncbi:MAG: HlyD family type I secretion periplasmic adaptor subunit [Sphingomicrobium sp.]
MSEVVDTVPNDIELAAQDAPFESSTTVDSPDRDIRVGLIIAGIFFILFLGWATFAPLDAAAIAQGRLTVSGQRQTIQHREGGVVSEILIKEGAYVRKGQVLIRLGGADVRAQERALSAQSIGLLAQRARLRAEQSGTSMIIPPREFAALTGEDRVAAADAMRIQQTQLRTRAAVLSAQRGALGQRTAQANSQGQGYGSQLESINEQLRLIDDELTGMRSAADKGFVSKNRIRQLERARADLIGQRGQYTATIAQSRGSASESRLQSLEAISNYQERIASDLRDVETALNDVLPKLSAAKDMLDRIEIKAPVDGSVVGLTVFTPGGVVAPGQKLLDIVPNSAPLTIEARLSVADGDDVQVGQKAFVRFDTLHDKTLPPLDGLITRVSADAFTDEKSGAPFYTAEVSVPLSELEEIERTHGKAAVRAGVPVSITIPIRKRTALQYMFEPLTASLRRSFKEH